MTSDASRKSIFSQKCKISSNINYYNFFSIIISNCDLRSNVRLTYNVKILQIDLKNYEIYKRYF